MIAGTVTFEDITIHFTVNGSENTVTYTVVEQFPDGTSIEEMLTVSQDKFFKAFAIMVHNDGMPEYEHDYPDAESIMKKVRWIP